MLQVCRSGGPLLTVHEELPLLHALGPQHSMAMLQPQALGNLSSMLTAHAEQS